METFSQRKPEEENCGTVFGMAMDITFFYCAKGQECDGKVENASTETTPLCC